MFEKNNPSELRIYLKPILVALEADKGDEWVRLWGLLQRFDSFLESEAGKKVPAKLEAPLFDPED